MKSLFNMAILKNWSKKFLFPAGCQIFTIFISLIFVFGCKYIYITDKQALKFRDYLFKCFISPSIYVIIALTLVPAIFGGIIWVMRSILLCNLSDTPLTRTKKVVKWLLDSSFENFQKTIFNFSISCFSLMFVFMVFFLLVGEKIHGAGPVFFLLGSLVFSFIFCPD